MLTWAPAEILARGQSPTYPFSLSSFLFPLLPLLFTLLPSPPLVSSTLAAPCPPLPASKRPLLIQLEDLNHLRQVPLSPLHAGAHAS